MIYFGNVHEALYLSCDIHVQEFRPNLWSMKTYSENVLNFRIPSSPLPKTDCMIILFRKPSSEIVKFWAPGLEFFGPGQYGQVDKAVNLTTLSGTNFHLLIDKLPLIACRSLFAKSLQYLISGARVKIIRDFSDSCPPPFINSYLRKLSIKRITSQRSLGLGLRF